jgi:hypothetical protein
MRQRLFWLLYIKLVLYYHLFVDLDLRAAGCQARVQRCFSVIAGLAAYYLYLVGLLYIDTYIVNLDVEMDLFGLGAHATENIHHIIIEWASVSMSRALRQRCKDWQREFSTGLKSGLCTLLLCRFYMELSHDWKDLKSLLIWPNNILLLLEHMGWCLRFCSVFV